MDDNDKEIYMNITLTRSEFEELINPFIKKSLLLVEETIKES
jgi:molecular chaperone DnaK (HSP70)